MRSSHRGNSDRRTVSAGTSVAESFTGVPTDSGAIIDTEVCGRALMARSPIVNKKPSMNVHPRNIDPQGIILSHSDMFLSKSL
jgi:hypothetical protein